MELTRTTPTPLPNWPLTLKLGVLFSIAFILWLFNRDYITPISLGFIMAVLTFPLYTLLYQRLFRHKIGSQGIAALLTIVLICVGFGLLLNIITREIIREIPTFANGALSFARGLPDNQAVLNALSSFGVGKDTLQLIVNSLNQQIEGISRIFGASDTSNTAGINEQELDQVLSISRQFFNIIFSQLVYLVIFILAWLNGLLFGSLWIRHLLDLLPLHHNEKNRIMINLKEGIRNVIYANLLSGFVHASLCFVLMFAFGVPNLFIITVLIFLIGVLPLSPSELGYAIPFFIIFPQNPTLILLLIPVAEVIILWVNNVLIPRIIASGQEGNPLLILTSILSGISIFGLMGFVIGPVIMIFVQTIYRMFVSRLQTYETPSVQEIV